MLRTSRPLTSRSRQQGSVIVFLAVTLVVIMGFAALGFDLAYHRYVKFQLRNTNDAAAHAAAIRLRGGDQGDALFWAKELGRRNEVEWKPLNMKDSDVVFGHWDFTWSQGHALVADPNPNAVQVSASRTVGSNDGPLSTFFAKVIGFRTLEAKDEDAAAAIPPRDMIIAQDITGSFEGAIDDAAKADQLFFDLLAGKVNGLTGAQGGTPLAMLSDRIGLNVFTGGAKTITPLDYFMNKGANQNLQWFDGSLVGDAVVSNRISLCNSLDVSDPGRTTAYTHCWMPPCDSGPPSCVPGEQCLTCPAKVAPMGCPYNPGNQVLTSCFTPDPGNAGLWSDGTAHGPAIRNAVDEFQKAPDWQFRTKVLILVTDGLPECCKRDGGGLGPNQDCRYADTKPDACNQARYKEGLDEAKRAGDLGINIYTVYFNSGARAGAVQCDPSGRAVCNNPGAPALGPEYTGCLAKGIGVGYCTPDSKKLSTILADIAKDIPVTLVK